MLGRHDCGAMYVIRATPESTVIEARLSGVVDTSEALRAVSQAFALADAGGLARILVDIVELTANFDPVVVATSLAIRLESAVRIALICTEEHLPGAREFAKLARGGGNFGVFTRSEDAEAWLVSTPGHRLSGAAAVRPASGAQPRNGRTTGERRSGAA